MMKRRETALLPHQAAFAYRIFLLSALPISVFLAVFGGPPLTGFLLKIGASNSFIGLVSALGALGQICQVLTAYILEKGLDRKKVFLISSIVARIIIALSVLVPIVLPGAPFSVRISIVIILFFLHNAIGSATNVSWMSWTMEIIEEKRRGSFFGNRLALFSMGGVAAGLIFGYLLDRYESGYNGFLIVFGIAMVAGLIDSVMHIRVPRAPDIPRSETVRFWDLIQQPFKHAGFRYFVIFSMLFHLSILMMGPFSIVYMLNNLKTGYLQVSIAQAIFAIVSTVFFWPWGVVIDRFGARPTLILGAVAIAVTPLLWVFTTPENYMMINVVQVLSGIFWPAVTLAINNLMLGLGPKENRSIYIGSVTFLNAIAMGFGPLLGGVIADALQGISFDVAGLRIGNLQLLFIISALARTAMLPLLVKISGQSERPALFVLDQMKSRDMPRAMANLRTLRREADESLRRNAARTLGGLKSELGVAELIEALEDPSPRVREEAATALGEIGSDESVSALTISLRDPMLSVQIQAAKALGRIGSPEAVKLLLSSFAGEDNHLKAAAAEALGEMRYKGAVDDLMQLLKEPRYTHLFLSSAEALCKIGETEAVQYILPEMRKAGSPMLRKQLASGLGNLLGPEGEFYSWQKREDAEPGSAAKQAMRDMKRPMLRSMGRQLYRQYASKMMEASLLDNKKGVAELSAELAERLTSEGTVSISPKTGQQMLRLGRWFIDQAVQQTMADEVSFEEALLSLYALRQIACLLEGDTG